MEIYKNAICEINENYIETKPMINGYQNSSCTYCSYKSICKFNAINKVEK